MCSCFSFIWLVIWPEIWLKSSAGSDCRCIHWQCNWQQLSERFCLSMASEYRDLHTFCMQYLTPTLGALGVVPGFPWAWLALDDWSYLLGCHGWPQHGSKSSAYDHVCDWWHGRWPKLRPQMVWEILGWEPDPHTFLCGTYALNALVTFRSHAGWCKMLQSWVDEHLFTSNFNCELLVHAESGATWIRSNGGKFMAQVWWPNIQPAVCS